MQMKNKGYKIFDETSYCLTTKDREHKNVILLVIASIIYLSCVSLLFVTNTKWPGRMYWVSLFYVLLVSLQIRGIYHDHRSDNVSQLKVSREGIHTSYLFNQEANWEEIKAVRLSMKKVEGRGRNTPCLSIELSSCRKCWDFDLGYYNFDPYQLRSALRNFSDGYDVEIDADRKLWMFFYCNPFHNGYKSE